MADLRLTIEEIEGINEGINEYISALLESTGENVNVVSQFSCPGGGRFFKVSMSFDFYDGQYDYHIIWVEEIHMDEYFDALNDTKNYGKRN